MPTVLAKKYYNTALIATTPGFHVITLPLWVTGHLYTVGQGVTFEALTYRAYLTCKTTHISSGISPLMSDAAYWNMGYYDLIDGSYNPDDYVVLYRSGVVSISAGAQWIAFSTRLPEGTLYTLRPPIKGVTPNDDTIDARPFWNEGDDPLEGFRINFSEPVVTEFLAIQIR